jgi:tripartite-type tricarboxylate transporter receptor subunit TctC
MAPVAQHIKGGQLRALAVTSATPSSLVPGLPTVASSGVPGFESAVWNGLVAPANTPPDIVQRLQTEVAAILAQPDVREQIRTMGFEPVGSTPAQFKDFLAAETTRSAKIVHDAAIHID